MSVVQWVDETLKNELTRGPLRASAVPVSFDTPDSDWAARRSGPCVNLFLYGIEEDSSRNQSGGVSVIDEQGTVIGYGSPPRYFRLTYLVSVWAQSVQDEHRMLGSLLEWCVRTDELVADPRRPGDLSRVAVNLQETDGGSESAASRLWSSLGTPARPVLDLAVTVPLRKPDERSSPAPAKGMGLRARQLDGFVAPGRNEDTARHTAAPDSGPSGPDTGPRTRPGPGRPRRKVEEIA